MGVPSYTIKTDSTSTANTIYVGRCNSLQTDDDKPIWQIQRITISGNDITVENSEGNLDPIYVWNDRTTTVTYK